ncbi:uncharacterized protein LOC116203218 [Punica granatum]|uniref:Uncharacterized protein LOC116203218 n=1 Tax=Punica granatum TaxID=22663 RepID=A0A6P8DB86_PUNGR|nr:uncharacterized protein LOC116203218 [Punica granatum]
MQSSPSSSFRFPPAVTSLLVLRVTEPMFVASRRRGLLCLSSSNSTIPNPSPFPNPPLLQFIALRFLSAQASEQEDSPTVSVLVDSLGFPPETALSVLRKLQNKDPRNAGSVISFLESRDFSAAQISGMVRRWPRLLRLKPKRTLLPKLEGVLKSDVKALQVIICGHRGQGGAHEITALPNLKYLVDNGVSESNVACILRYQPQKLYTSCARLSEAMLVLKGMGLDPQKTAFVHALSAVLGLSKPSWESKLRVYRNWGWSEEEFISAFRKCPHCMTASEDKINRVMNFFVDRLGWKPSLIAEHSTVLGYSFEKRIILRAAVLQFLLSKGLIDRRYSLVQILTMNEKLFMKRIAKYPEVAPHILAIYNEELSKPR